MNTYFLLAFFSSWLAVVQRLHNLCRSNAKFETETSQVILDWNMISHTDKTTYQLQKKQ